MDTFRLNEPLTAEEVAKLLGLKLEESDSQIGPMYVLVDEQGAEVAQVFPQDLNATAYARVDAARVEVTDERGRFVSATYTFPRNPPKEDLETSVTVYAGPMEDALMARLAEVGTAIY